MHLYTYIKTDVFFWKPKHVHVQVIAPEEIIDPSADEQSVMTYLSQFPQAKLKPGAPLKPKLNPKKVRSYGPGTLTKTHTQTQWRDKVYNIVEHERTQEGVLFYFLCVVG